MLKEYTIKMSKYVAPRFRKDETDEEKNAKLIEMVRDASVSDFPVLGGGVQVHRLPKLEYAAKTAEWEQKRRDAEEKQRVDDYVKKIQEEKAKDDLIMIEMMSSYIAKQPTERLKVIVEPPPPVTVDEWVRVERKPRKEKKVFTFEEADDRIDFLNIQEEGNTK